MKIESLIDDSLTARFVRYQDGVLWYEVGHLESQCDSSIDGGPCQGWFEFPVDLIDAPGIIFTDKMKAASLEQWIRKQLESQTQ